VPEHYEQVGVVSRFVKKLSVVGIHLTAGDVRAGDTIAFELPLWFVEQKVESLEVDNQRQGRAMQGQVCGVVTTLSRAEVRDGVRVFRVRQHAAKATAESTASVASSAEPPDGPDRK
jgi:hypothetical protein